MKNIMKSKLILVIFVIPFLFAFQCDDDDLPHIAIHNLDLVSIENNQSLFSVGDYIYITTTIDNRQISNEGETVFLKDFLELGSSSIDFSLVLKKQNTDGTMEEVIIEEVQELEGSVSYGNEIPIMNISNTYDETSDTFHSKIGVRLLDEGTYSLKGGLGFGYDFQFVIIRLSRHFSLTLKTSIMNSNEIGIYEFVVE